jgi:protein-disulfide isomerase
MSTLKIPLSPADHVLGPSDAPVVMVEYGDYECPHCGTAHAIVQAVLAQFGAQLRFAYRHFPLTQIHPNAQVAAESAEFAGAHGQFWRMHDGIFENQPCLGLPFLFALTGDLSLSEADLRNALVNGMYTPKVRNDALGGLRSGVNGTPAFFINGRRHKSGYTLSDLICAIENNLHSRVPS